LKTAVKLIKVFDRDGSGTIDFYEYASLHKFITSLQTAFTTADSVYSLILSYESINKLDNDEALTVAFYSTNT